MLNTPLCEGHEDVTWCNTNLAKHALGCQKTLKKTLVHSSIECNYGVPHLSTSFVTRLVVNDT